MKTEPDWAAFFIRFLKNDAKGSDVLDYVSTLNALVIVDYASDFTRPLKDIIRSAANSSREGRRIRFLLLARTASWEQRMALNSYIRSYWRGYGSAFRAARPSMSSAIRRARATRNLSAPR